MEVRSFALAGALSGLMMLAMAPAAPAVTLLGMLLTLIAAIKADNPTSPIAITLVGVAILMLTVRRRPEAAS